MVTITVGEGWRKGTLTQMLGCVHHHSESLTWFGRIKVLACCVCGEGIPYGASPEDTACVDLHV